MTTPPHTANNDKATSTADVVALREEVAELKHQLAWFKKQLFGSKSEKRQVESPDQLLLFGAKQTPVPEDQPKQKISYERGKFKKHRDDECVTEEGLRFDSSVPVKTIVLPVLGAQGLSVDEYEVIGTKVFHKLCLLYTSDAADE